ncbi:centriole, cilia and spindle-associated protein-like [Myxocyprinus asiaticus]|uniref:centriole, cilia and spindle-associated protein-like n=1 Tax=Myxocyprinus asiaticus TaxID=70543 RepID=UPI002223942A|nr:centriole, cilia and spindle-associated protein-like [Myxocyprinus asiaticus]
MVTKRIRSEYMKKFKDPKWETYAKCYEDLLKYRLSRRLLEQAHNPWFWGEWGSDTASSGKSTPLCRNKVEPLRPHDETAEPAAEPGPQELQDRKTVETKLVTRNTEQSPQGEEEEKSRECSPALNPDLETDTHTLNKPKSKQRSSHKCTRSKVKPHATKDTDKENRHPFALYGSGERHTDMASKKTHNVGPAASTSEIHESALRAKTRREVENQIKRVDKQRARSADIEMNRSKVVPEYNPWMTEYMRCFSARSR